MFPLFVPSIECQEAAHTEYVSSGKKGNVAPPKRQPRYMQYLGEYHIHSTQSGRDSLQQVRAYEQSMNMKPATHHLHRLENHLKAMLRPAGGPFRHYSTLREITATTKQLSDSVLLPALEGKSLEESMEESPRHRMLSSIIDEIVAESITEPLPPGIRLLPEDVVNFAAHLATGGAIRALEVTADTATGDGVRSTTVLYGEHVKDGCNLGDVVRANSMPMPNRLLDKCSNYLWTTMNHSIRPTPNGEFPTGQICPSTLFTRSGDAKAPVERARSNLSSDGKKLREMLFTTILFKVTGRVDRWESLQEHLNRTTVHRMGTTLAPEQLPDILDYIRSTVDATNRLSSISAWTGDQFKESIPEDCRTSFVRLAGFMRGVAAGIDDLADGLIQIVALTPEEVRYPNRRESAVSLVTDFLTQNLSGANVGRPNFIAHHVISEIEEIFRDIFGKVVTVPVGHGGQQGLKAVHIDSTARERIPAGTVKGLEAAAVVLDYIQNQCADEILLPICWFRDPSGVVRNMVNERELNIGDSEHVACKIYIGISRTRGTRAHNRPRSVAACNYPFRFKFLLPESTKKLFEKMIAAHSKLVQERRWPDLHDAFAMGDRQSVPNPPTLADFTSPQVTGPSVYATPTKRKREQLDNGPDSEVAKRRKADSDKDFVNRKTTSDVLAILRAISDVLVERRASSESHHSATATPSDLTEFWNSVTNRVSGVNNALSVLKEVLGCDFTIASEWIDSCSRARGDGDNYEIYPLDLRNKTTVALGQIRYNRVDGYKLGAGHGWNSVTKNGKHIRYRTSVPGHSVDKSVRRNSDSSIVWDNLRMLGPPKTHFEKGSQERPVGELLQEDVANKVEEVMANGGMEYGAGEMKRSSSNDVSTGCSTENVKIHSTDMFSCYTRSCVKEVVGPQEAHVDLDPADCQKAREQYGVEPLVGICPLTKEGSLLYVWDSKTQKAKLVFTPLGSILLLGAGTYHAGNLCYGSEENSNQRLHLVACHGDSEELFSGGEQKNYYPSDEAEMDHLMGMIGSQFTSQGTETTAAKQSAAQRLPVAKLTRRLLWESRVPNN